MVSKDATHPRVFVTIFENVDYHNFCRDRSKIRFWHCSNCRSKYLETVSDNIVNGKYANELTLPPLSLSFSLFKNQNGLDIFTKDPFTKKTQ
jgi:hypothetical protein